MRYPKQPAAPPPRTPAELEAEAAHFASHLRGAVAYLAAQYPTSIDAPTTWQPQPWYRRQWGWLAGVLLATAILVAGIVAVAT